MRHLVPCSLGLTVLALVSGCRTAARVTTVPRVDLELEGVGNRGYLVGTPPPAQELKTTRQMVETDVEIPSFYKPTRTGGQVSLEGVVPPERESSDESAAMTSGTEPAPGTYDTYVVQKGDSLWSIAAKPEIYGKATHWRRIFDANRDLLKTPDRLKAGMTLKIPRGDAGQAAEDEGTTFKK